MTNDWLAERLQMGHSAAMRDLMNRLRMDPKCHFQVDRGHSELRRQQESAGIRFATSLIQVGGGEVYIRSAAGSSKTRRPPLVCIHGLGISGKYMMPFAREMAGVETHVPDLPGYGLSYRPERTLPPEGLADALAEIVDVLGLPAADFLGNSYGCQVLAEFGSRYPEKVGKMIFVGPTVDPARRTFRQQFYRLLKSGLYEKFSLAGLLLSDAAKAGPGVMIPTVKFALKHRVEDILPLVPSPVLVIRGSHDFMAGQAWCEEVARLLPRATLEVVDGGAHALNYSHPVALAEAVRRFLDCV